MWSWNKQSPGSASAAGAFTGAPRKVRTSYLLIRNQRTGFEYGSHATILATGVLDRVADGATKPEHFTRAGARAPGRRDVGGGQAEVLSRRR